MEMVKNGQTAPSEVNALRAAGKLTLADEEHLVRLDHEIMRRACPATRRILAPVVAEQIAAYEAAKR